MIAVILLFISLVIPFILGMVLFYFINPNHFKVMEKIIICFAFGTAMLTFLMFVWGLLRLPFYFFLILMFCLSALIFLFSFIKFFNKKRFFNQFLKLKIKKLGLLEWFFILIILFEILFVLSSSILRPIINFDSLAIWALKAKVFFYQPVDFFNHASSFFLGGGNKLNYPLHIPLFMGWVYLLFQGTSAIFAKIIFATYFIALLAFIYISLRNFISRKTSLFLTAILSLMPLVSYHGFSAMADLPMAFYFTLASVFLFKYFYRPSSSYNLYLAGIFAGITAWVKSEGIVLSMVLLFVLFVYLISQPKLKTNIKNCLKFLYPYLLIISPWVVFKIFYNINFLSNISKKFLFFEEIHPVIFKGVWQQIFFSNSFSIWPAIFLLFLLFFYKKVLSKPYLYLLLMISGVILFYLLLYFLTPTYEYAMDGTAVCRNFLVIIPLSIFLSGLLFEHKY